MDFIKNIVNNKINLLGFFIAFIGAYLLFQNFFEANVYPVPLSQPLWMSLDPSWGIALNYASINNLVWGEEISFTYGPLSYLTTRIGWGHNKFVILFYDLFVLVNYFFIFYFSVSKTKNKLITILSIVSICIIFPTWSGYAGTLILMAFLIFWIKLSIDEPKIFYYVFQIIIVTLAFFIKFNTGLIALPFFLSGLIYNFIIHKEKKIYFVLFALIPFILIILFSNLLNVSLLPYIKSGLEMIKGYNQIMYLENSIHNSIIHACILLGLVLLITLINLNVFDKEKWFKNLVILFLTGSSFFILYKQTFTRADGHVFDFFIFVPILILCNIDLHFNTQKRYLKILFIVVLLIPFKFLIFDNEREIEITTKLPKTTYLSGFNAFTPTSGMHLIPNTSQFPQNVLNKIGNQTVDIFPWNIQLLLLNNLNYKPRPVIQSYTAYTSYLEEMNFQHYNSNKAPEFVVYDLASIDGRYAFFDEPKVNLALTKNYKIVEKFDFDGRNLLLLQKRSDFKPLKFEKIKEYAMYIDSPLVPEEGTFYQVGVYDNFLGKIVSIIEHSPEIQLLITTEDGSISEFRTSKLLLESGLFFNRFVNETSKFSNIFEAPDLNTKVKYYNFKPIHPSQYKDKIKITEYKIAQ